MRPRQRRLPRPATLQVRSGSLLNFTADCQDRAIAIGLHDLDRSDHRLCAVDADVSHERRELRLAWIEAERPLLERAHEAHVKYSVESGQVAREGCPDALDERHYLRVALHIELVAMPPALCAHHAVLEHQGLGFWLQSALLEPIGRVIEQLAAGLDGTVEDREVFTLDETHFAVLVRGERAHQAIEILCGPCGERPAGEGTHDRGRGEPTHARARGPGSTH